jgi:hypothetical protein
MPSVFDSHFASAGFPLLLSQFGESITYWPRAGGSRLIDAIIEREPPAIYDASGNAVMPRAVIRVYNSCRSGIASNEIDTGGDEVELELKIGDRIKKRCSVMVMQSQDSGVTVLAVM